MSRHLSPRYGHVILVSGYPVIDHNIRLQAPTLARKCDISHWFPVVRMDWRMESHLSWID